METDKITGLIEHLKGFATPERFETLQTIVRLRTDYLTVVLEDIHQPHNASAVLRSCDGFGVQNIHVIENVNEFDASSQVTIGADRWLNIKRYNKENANNTRACLSTLKDKGYRIIATTPHENESELHRLDISRPVALVFGNELDGISDEVRNHADGFVKIPMYGFSESFNISVSAAICLYDLTLRIRRPGSGINWELEPDEQQKILLNWLKKSVKAGDNIIRNYLQAQEED